MQWQRDYSDASVATGPPPVVKGEDPLDSEWRRKNGYRLVVIGYYSKTLDKAQRNYAIFDKEAGAVLLCVRHWSDLISYHPTTVYTDSAVAASMLTKHAAPPRLQRWGLELGAYLPHLRISFRRGNDNGLADLLSRFPAFNDFTKRREDPVQLPDDLFEKMGDAPMFNPALLKHKRRESMGQHIYELYDLKSRHAIHDPIWNSTDGPEIPGRGATGTTVGDDVPTADSWMEDVASAAAEYNAIDEYNEETDLALTTFGNELRAQVNDRLAEVDRDLRQFATAHDRPLHVTLVSPVPVADALEYVGIR